MQTPITDALRVFLLLEIGGTESYAFRLELNRKTLFLRLSKEYSIEDPADFMSGDIREMEVTTTWDITESTKILAPDHPGAAEDGNITVREIFGNLQSHS